MSSRKSDGNVSEKVRPSVARAMLRPFVLFAAALAIALPSVALQVSPTYQVFQVKPGGKTEGQMTLTNNEPIEVTITPGIKEWFKLNVNDKHDVSSWIRLDDDDEFTLKGGESKVITYKLLAPKKAKGELAGAITFSTKPQSNMLTLQLSVVQYVGILGTEKVDTEVAGLGVKVSSNTDVGVMIRNTGNVHVRPRGYIYVDDTSGQRVLNVEIPVGQPAFPGTERAYYGTVKGFKLAPGNYTARIELTDVDRPIEFPVVKKKFSIDADGKVEVR